METELLKLVSEYSRNKKYADHDFIMRVIELFKEHYSLSDYLENVIFKNDTEDTETLVAYRRSVRCISIYYPNIINYINQIDGNFSYFDEEERFFYQNLNIVKFLLHDLEHALQTRKVDGSKNDIEAKLLMASFYESNEKYQKPMLSFGMWDYIDKVTMLYDKLYSRNPAERMAEINSLKTLKKLIVPLKDEMPVLFQFESDCLINEMISGYSENKLKCPTEIFLTESAKEMTDFIPELLLDNDHLLELLKNECPKLNLEDRLLYGLPVTPQEYEGQQKLIRFKNIEYN